jgi:hypothetical protein
VAGKSYKQVVVTESYNANRLKLFPYYPSDTHKDEINGRRSTLIFAPNIILNTQVNHTAPINTDPHYGKALPSKIDYERLSPYFAFRPHDDIQNTLRQTMQLPKSTIH